MNRSKLQYRIILTLFIFLFVTSCASNGGRNKVRNNNRTENVKQVLPDSPEMLNVDLGVGYLKRGKEGDLDFALEKFKKAVAINPKFALAHSMLANVYDRKALFDDAERHYKLSIKFNNNSPDIINNYANFLCQRNQYDQAVELYLEVVKDPEYKTPAIAYENAGICMKGSGNLSVAESHFRKALDLNPQMPNSLYNLMKMYFDKSNYMKSRAFLQRLEQVVSPSAEMLAAGYQIEKALKNDDLANTYYSKLKQNFPNSDAYKKLQ